MPDASLLIETVSDTALIVAYARAMETERSHPLFQDPFARSLAGERGQRIYSKIRGDYSLEWLISTRTCLLDQLILQSIATGVTTVLNLAAGLDTRPYRMALPPDLHWIEVDLPGILDYKQGKLADAKPVCILERVPLDLTLNRQRQQFLSNLNTSANRVLIMTEGLLVYLTLRQVQAIATDLAQQPYIASWLTDLMSPLAAQLAQLRMSGQISGNVQLQFAPGDPAAFFQSCGWQIAAERSLWQEAQRLKRGIVMGGLLGWLPAFNLSIVQMVPG